MYKTKVSAHTKIAKKEVKMRRFNSGELAPQSGKYAVCDKNGRRMATVSMQKGDHLPPTQSSEYYYEYCE